MREAGLVHGELDGPRICYCAGATRVQRRRELLAALVSPAGAVRGTSISELSAE